MIKLYIKNSIRTNNFNDPNVVHSIEKLWEETLNSLGKISFDLYGVYHNYESDYRGNYELSIATKTIKTTQELIVPNEKYQIFKVIPNNSDSIFQTWKTIWEMEENGKINRAYTIDFEHYHVNGDIDIYIAIKS